MRRVINTEPAKTEVYRAAVSLDEKRAVETIAKHEGLNTSQFIRRELRKVIERNADLLKSGGACA